MNVSVTDHFTVAHAVELYGLDHWGNGYLSIGSNGHLMVSPDPSSDGKLDVYEEWVRAITRIDVVTLLDLSWKKTGLVKGDRIINTLAELVGHVQIEDLPIAFTAVAALLGLRLVNVL